MIDRSPPFPRIAHVNVIPVIAKTWAGASPTCTNGYKGDARDPLARACPPTLFSVDSDYATTCGGVKPDADLTTTLLQL